MIAKLINLLKKKNSGPDRIEAVLAGFSGMINELGAAREDCDAAAKNNQELIQHLISENKSLDEASARARTVVNNLHKLLGE